MRMPFFPQRCNTLFCMGTVGREREEEREGGGREGNNVEGDTPRYICLCNTPFVPSSQIASFCSCLVYVAQVIGTDRLSIAQRVAFFRGRHIPRQNP
jgi:hypothetical protein